MAPRAAKAKKTTSLKVAESEAPKKGKANAKNVSEPGIDADEVADEVPAIEKKTKRGKKAEGDTNGTEETNGVDAAPQKKGRKMKNGDSSSSQKDVSKDVEDPKQDADEVESNGHSEELPVKGKKKTTKKEPAASKSKSDTKTSSRGKKNAKPEADIEMEEKDEVFEEKSKPAGKGRNRKAPQKANKEPELEEKNESGEEEMKTEPSKGRKRGPAKTNKEKTPESEPDVPEAEELPAEEPKKKEAKGKKNQGKKAKLAENGDEEEKQEPATKKRKVMKKDKIDEVKDEDSAEEAVAEPKPAKGKRGAKKTVVAEPEDEAAGDAGKRRRKADEKEEEPNKKAPAKNKTTTEYDKIDFSNTSKNAQGKDWNLKIASWNVDGIRAWMSKGGLDYLKFEKPDILCLQEIKCAKDKLPDEAANLPGYHAYWQSSDKDGYAGVGIYTTKLAMNVQYGLQNEELDNEGRIITAEYEQFYLICTYVPNAGRKLVTLPKRLQWNEEFRKHVNALNAKKPVIICGDMNVAHNEIDLSNPKANKKNAGFTEEERAGMTELLGDGFVDTYRRLQPDSAGAYTFWTYMSNARSKNVGWRLDYFLMSERLLPALCDSVIRSDVYGSDHCPITLFLHITSADKPKE